MILCSCSCPNLWLLFTAAALFHQLTEAEIAFAVLHTSSVGGSWSLVDTHGSTSSTGGQDQPRPLHCFHRDDDDDNDDDDINDDNDDDDVDTHGSPSSTGGQLGPPFTLFSSSSSLPPSSA